MMKCLVDHEKKRKKRKISAGYVSSKFLSMLKFVDAN